MGFQLTEFDEGSIRRIAQTVTRLEAQVYNLQRQLLRVRPSAQWMELFTGKTTTSADLPTYPTAGCQFVVQVENWGFDETVGSCPTLTTTAHTSKFVLARTIDGSLLAENTRVFGFRIAGQGARRHWIMPVATFKPEVRFTLDAVLATSDASKSATITDQYGPGTANPTLAITVHNLLTDTAGSYLFSGPSAAAGLAFHDSGQNYRIHQLQCDETQSLQSAFLVQMMG